MTLRLVTGNDPLNPEGETRTTLAICIAIGATAILFIAILLVMAVIASLVVACFVPMDNPPDWAGLLWGAIIWLELLALCMALLLSDKAI